MAQPIFDFDPELLPADVSDASQVWALFDNLQGVPETRKMSLATLTTLVQPSGSVDTAELVEFPATNSTGVTLNAGEAVHVNGWSAPNGNALIELADASAGKPAHGLLTTAIAGSAEGVVTRIGYVPADTSTASVGDSVWLGAAGGLVYTQPTTGIIQRVGTVHDSSVTGQVYADTDVPQSAAQFIFFPETDGAIGDGANDDGPALLSTIAAAEAVNGIVYLRGKYRTTVSLPVTATIAITGASRESQLIGDNSWQNLPLLDVQADHVHISDLSIIETGASPTNAAKSGSQNSGLKLTAGRYITVDNIAVDGFGYPLLIRNNAGTSALENPRISNSEFSRGYSWNELDSCQGAQFRNCHLFTNGLDGFKGSNQNARTIDGLVLDSCESYNNGQRDIAAGGTENTNGNGFDLFNGGYRFAMINCRAYGNYGSGFVMKGPTPTPIQGEGAIVSSQFMGALATNANVSHGVELGESFSNNGSQLTFVGCHMSENIGDGVFHGGGNGNTFLGCRMLQNDRYGINMVGGYSITHRDCNVQGNKGAYQVVVGISDSGTHTPRRILFGGGSITGNYDAFLAAGEDHIAGQTEVFSDNAIRIFSDSADVELQPATVANVLKEAILTSGDRIAVRHVRFEEIAGHAILNDAGAGTLDVTDSVINKAAALISYSSGSGTQPAVPFQVTGATSGAQGIAKALTTTSGTWPTNDAAGVLYVYEVTGVFQAGEALTITGATATADSVQPTIGIEIGDGAGNLRNNQLLLESLLPGSIGLLFKSGTGLNVDAHNRYTNWETESQRDSGSQFGGGVEDIGTTAGAATVIDLAAGEPKKRLVIDQDTDVQWTNGLRDIDYEIRYAMDATGNHLVTHAATSLAQTEPTVKMAANKETVLLVRLDNDGDYHWK